MHLVRGTVKMFIEQRGIGYIEKDDVNTPGVDVYVTANNIEMENKGDYPNLEPGDRVEFNLVKTDYGEIAHNVSVINEE